MDSASFQFIFFGLAVAILSNLSRSQVWRSAVLFLASLFFLGTLAPNPLLLLPFAGFLLVGYAALLLLQRGWSRALVVSVVIVIACYVWLKKYTFLPEAVFLHHPYFTLGLSYIFFRVLHLLIETGEGSEKRQVGLGAYLLYTLNFTTLVSGPIQRYDDFARDQFASDPIPLSARTVCFQIERIVRGFFKVNVLAMVLHAYQQDALLQISETLPLTLKLLAGLQLAVLYPFFLYFNFSGYIDIVIALARLLRVRLPENFDRPFSATSFLDFWNRWHITLSSWLKTYVYNPLLTTLMRRITSISFEPWLGVFCLFVTFFLVGIWHGRTSEFAIFGVLQGGGVSVNQLWRVLLTRSLGRKRYKELANDSLYRSFARGLTFTWFAFTLFWFWASWSQLDRAFRSLTTVEWLGVWLTIWISATVVLEAWEQLRPALLDIRTANGPVLLSRYARVVYTTVLAIVAVVMTFLLNQPAPGIVYKAF